METTFISIHDLSPDARLHYTSDSIVDILGYGPQEVIGRSCFDYFHPDEIPFARSVHGRGVQMDKAAVLTYCRIRSKYGHWVGCECVFTIVYDVLVASTSIYRRGMKSQKRAVEAPIIRRLFSSSPQDPRYHMLSHLSSKFLQAPNLRKHEPRAALFLNRFTRSLAIMYATTALSAVLGISADEAKGKSFYECIQENCLPSAIRCLEGAKANDSICYMRFWFRDPRRGSSDQAMTDVLSSDEDDDGGVNLTGGRRANAANRAGQQPSSGIDSRSSSGNSTDLGAGSDINIFGERGNSSSSNSSLSTSEQSERRSPSNSPEDPIEVEAVISCTSDGLVVILRRARPIVSSSTMTTPPPVYSNGIFASPWAAPPIMPAPEQMYGMNGSLFHDHDAGRANAVGPSRPNNGPAMDDFMTSIREVAVFAWSLTGINGSLADYGRGVPMGEATPADGFRVWDPNGQHPEEGQLVASDYRAHHLDTLASQPAAKWAEHEYGHDMNGSVNVPTMNTQVPLGPHGPDDQNGMYRWF